MASNYARICQDNIRRRGEEFDDIGSLIAEHLYSDSSHFVYELLQNAEDALRRRFRHDPDNRLPCRVQFRLYRDRLEFRHFGHPFNNDDVKGISDVLKGTKADDPVQIGKFGIGFKSVYAFTASPEIHSGDEHFVIRRYIRPEAKEPIPGVATYTDQTVFIFPFDHKNMSADRAFDLIAKKLRTLGARVLLFLRRIDKIEWDIESDRERGQYRRTSSPEDRKDVRRVRLTGSTSDCKEKKHWLVFERPVTIQDRDETISVEIAFQLNKDTNSGPESINKIDPSPLFVYFPTDKNTKFGFLVHGPYLTTSARDNVRTDNEWSRKLVNETAVLIVDALQHLKEMGLLSVSALETLPIRPSDFPHESMFYPVFASVRQALRDKDLLPTHDGDKFVAANDAKLARGSGLIDLLSDDQLGKLCSAASRFHWLSAGITQDRTPDLRYYLIEELSVEEVTPDGFARKISKAFLECQSDKWLGSFYRYLLDQRTLWHKPVEGRDSSGGILRGKPILRLHNGTHVAPFLYNIPSAYLPALGSTSTVSRTVRSALLEDESARRFLTELGIPYFDLAADVMDRILPKYEGESNIPLDRNARDLEIIEKAFNIDSQEKKKKLRSRLVATPFVPTECYNSGKVVYRKPIDVYFTSDDLCMYFADNDSFSAVEDSHPQSILFENLGVVRSVRITRRKSGLRGRVDTWTDWGFHCRGLNGFDPDIKVDGLAIALGNPTVEKSLFIWNHIAVDHADCIRGTVESSTRQTYQDSKREERVSEFGRLLIESAWLPDGEGEMHRPSDLYLCDLPGPFMRDENLARQLRMKKDFVAELCDEVGVSREDINLAREVTKASPEDRLSIQRLLRGQHENRPEFPQRRSADPERRSRILKDQLFDSSSKEYQSRERKVRTSRATIDPSVHLCEQYTNGTGQMVCQVCKNEMPFKKRDGKYYFVAVEALSRKYFRKEHVGQYLALCPLCAAMYHEFVTCDEVVMEQVYADLRDSKSLVVALSLGTTTTSIRFVETHRHDIRSILQDTR